MTIFFQLDLTIMIPEIWKNAPIVIIINVGLAILWVPLGLLLIKKYHANSNSKFWAKMSKDSYLTDQSVDFSLNQALSYLKEIETFEKEENNRSSINRNRRKLVARKTLN